MSGRLGDLYGDARRVYSQQGRSEFVFGALRYSRQRLPVELWPPLLFDPLHAADETVRVHETKSFELRYEGQHRDSLPRQLAAAEGRVLGADGAVYVYEDADVVGRRPVVGIDGTYFPPSWLGVDTAFFLHQEKYLKRNLPLRHALSNGRSRSSPERLVESGFLLLGERSFEFPAWHHEVLPKLRWLEEYESTTGESPTLIVPAGLSSFQVRSLELLGYDPESWVVAGGEPIRVERLLLAPHPRRAKGTHLHTSASELAWISDRIGSNVGRKSAEYSRRVYVSRRDADRRSVRNEDEVVEALREEGFSWYEPGRLSYEEEVRLFSGAEVVVGAHGMGLASIFHADDAALLELFPEGGATEHYFLTARECGFDYEYLACDPVYDGRNVRARDRDLIVDVDDLRSRLSSVV